MLIVYFPGYRRPDSLLKWNKGKPNYMIKTTNNSVCFHIDYIKRIAVDKKLKSVINVKITMIYIIDKI